MAMVRVCDRCGERDEVNDFVLMRADGKGPQKIDLCVKCRNKLDRFLSGDVPLVGEP